MSDDDESDAPVVAVLEEAPETVIEGDVVIAPPSEPPVIVEPPVEVITPADVEAAVADAVILERLATLDERLDTIADIITGHIEEHAAPEIAGPPVSEPVTPPLDENGEALPIERDDEIKPKEARTHPLFRSRSEWKHKD